MSETKMVPRSKWTADEREFDRLVNMAASRDQVTRIDGRFRLQRFVDLHGKEKCDAMWARIK